MSRLPVFWLKVTVFDKLPGRFCCGPHTLKISHPVEKFGHCFDRSFVFSLISVNIAIFYNAWLTCLAFAHIIFFVLILILAGGVI